MREKGFTLIELLGVIVIISILVLIVMPIVNSIIRDSKKEISSTNIDAILNSAYNWSIENNSLLPTNLNEETTISILDLKKNGYLKKDVYDALNSKKMADTCIVKIKKVSYDTNLDDVKDSKYFNDYLFAFECE